MCQSFCLERWAITLETNKICLNPATPHWDRPQENTFLLLCNGRETFGRVLKVWRTYGRSPASVGRDPPLPTGLDLPCPTGPGLLPEDPHPKISMRVLWGFCPQEGSGGQRTGGCHGGNGSPGSHTVLGKGSLPTDQPCWAEHTAPALTPSSKHLQAACGPRALHCCHKESKKGADSVPLLPRPCWGDTLSLGREREDSQEPPARPGLPPHSQAGLERARSLHLFAHPQLPRFVRPHAGEGGGEEAFHLPACRAGACVCACVMNFSIIQLLPPCRCLLACTGMAIFQPSITESSPQTAMQLYEEKP